jgi:putative ABC transport system permease protein
MNTAKQLVAVIRFNFMSLPRRLSSSMVTVSCIALAVGVMLGVLSLSYCISRVIESSSRPNRVVLLSEGAQLENMSAIPRTALAAIEDLPGIQRTKQGAAIVSAEVWMLPPLRERDSDKRAALVVRGVGPEHAALRPEIVVVEGRMFRSGLNEVVVGRRAKERFAGLSVGDTIRLRNVPFSVVGVFESNGSVRESEALVDVQSLISLRPKARYQSITVLLDSAAAIPEFIRAVARNPQLQSSALSETEYAQRRATDATRLMELMAYLIGAIMAAAATFSAANMMFTVVDARKTEFATLRAIGFGSTAIVTAICLESALLALTGAALGSSAVALIVNGLSFTSRRVTTELRIDWHLISIGALWACGIAILSALVPSIYAARLPVATALREP